MAFSDFLDDPLERPFFLRAASGGPPLDDDERRAYAEAIAARAPERAEWLRLELALRRVASDDPAIRARFVALSERCDGMWIQIMRRGVLLNCGRATAEPPRVRFSFVCERTWESLAPTEDACVRHCDGCGQSVHYTDDLVEADAHARAGRCITVPGALAQSASGRSTVNMTGRPDPIAHWAERLFP